MAEPGSANARMLGRGIGRYLPIAVWLPAYDRSLLRPDIVAGVSVWALLVPQGIAYSSVVGVPPQYGLYAALGALIGYALFGSSRQVITGPSATVAIVSASVVGLLAASGSAEWIAYTAALALFSGIVFAVLGLARAGWISNFLSRAVMGGFVFAFGIGLIIDQSHKILGVPKVEGTYFQQLTGTLAELPQANPYALAVGGSAIALLLLMRRYRPKWPRSLIAVVLGIIVVTGLGLGQLGVKVVGDVPTGLPALGLPSFSPSTIGTLLLGGVAVFFVGLSESLASAREMADKHEYPIDASQEMVAQGAANITSGLFGAFVVGGSLSKTTVADAAGQKSQMGSFVTAGLVVLTILFLAGLFANMADAVLGAIVIDAAIGLVKVKEFQRFRSTSRTAFAAFAAAGLGLLFIGVLAGIVIGALLSVLLLVAEVSGSPVREMAYDAKNDVFVEADTHPEAVRSDGILVAEIQGPLFYADASSFDERLLELAASDSTRGVVLDLGPTTTIDLDGADALTKVHRKLVRKEVRLALSRLESEHVPLLRKAGTLAEIGEGNVFPTTRAAVRALGGRLGRE